MAGFNCKSTHPNHSEEITRLKPPCWSSRRYKKND